MARETATKLSLNVLVRSSTDQMHNVAVQGPKSRDILEIIWTSPCSHRSRLEWFRFALRASAATTAFPSSSRAPATRASWL
jgi:aminomethyltransferase